MRDASPGSPFRIHVPFESTGRVLVDVPDALEDGPTPLLLVIHGFGRPTNELLAFGRRVSPAAIVAAPLGPSAFYRRVRTEGGPRREVRHGWIAAEDREHDDRRNDGYLRATLEELGRRFRIAPASTTVVGYSQGVGVATHFLLAHPELADGLVGLAGGLAEAYRSDLAKLSGKPVLWITGCRDEAYPPAYNEALVRAWREAGVRLRAIDLDAGHDLLPEAEEPVRQWLLDGSSR